MGRHGHASIHVALDDFVTKLKRGHAADSSLALARQTTEVLIHAVAAQQAPTVDGIIEGCLLYTSPSPRDATLSRMPSSA